MINKDEPVSQAYVDQIVMSCDSEFRLNFKDLIKEAKLLTHKCQYLCYKTKGDLKEAEECARNCFKPLLYAKKNISVLIENQKENFEKCRFQATNSHKDTGAITRQLAKCLGKYKEDLNTIKDEAEYIYKGYLKNYDTLLNEFGDNQKNI